MWSWLFGKKENQSQKEFGPIKEFPRKEPLWKENPNGTWIRTRPLNKITQKSNSAKILSSLPKTFIQEVATDVTATFLENTLERTFFPKEESSTPAPAPDSLDKFLLKLSESRIQLESRLKNFEDIKKSFSQFDKTVHPTQFSKSCTGKSIKQLFEIFFKKLKEGVEPAHDLIHNLIRDTEFQINTGREELAEAYKILKDENVSHEIKCPLHIEMCNRSISIVENILELIDKIKKKINNCLTLEKTAEVALTQLASFALHMVTNLPLFSLNYSFEQPYRNYLSNEIKEEKAEVENLVSDVNKDLDVGFSVLTQELAKETQIHANPSFLFQPKDKTVVTSQVSIEPPRLT